MRNRRRLYSVLGVTGLALFLIANHGRPEGVSQAPEESRTASRAETPEAPNRPTPATNGKAWPVRWVHRQTSFNSTDPADLASVLDVVIRGREWGLNGVVVADPKFFKLDIAEEDGGADRNRFLANLAEFMRECESDPDKPIDVILFVPVRSKAQAILAHDPNLAAGYKVEKARFTVGNGVATLMRDGDVSLRNPGFEEEDDDGKFVGWTHDRPGQATLPDREVFKFGRPSARLEPAAADKYGHCRFRQWVNVQPHRYYRVSVWLKTEGLTPARSVDIRVRGKLPFAKPRGRRRGKSWQVTCAGAWRWCNMSALGAEVIVWHGMFDPNHNAHEDYYLVDRPLTGSRGGSTGTSSSAPSTTTSARRA